MASGIRERFNTDIGLSVTGLAGPGGSTPDKPVGLVYIGIAGPRGIEHYQYNFTGSRTAIKQRAALAALSRLIHYIERL
jgi:nicotinamide-nucleotide amidase